jgi:uncharacterized RDD family membrane protein YckC
LPAGNGREWLTLGLNESDGREDSAMAEVVSGEAVVLELPSARFPSRMVAIFIDLLVQVVILILLLVAILVASPHLNADSARALLIVSGVLAIVGYPVIFETLSRGRSLGKMALGLRVVSDDGGPERFRQALVRGLASIVEIWGTTGAAALICSMISSRGKRLGDLFAGTFVIQERLPRRAALPYMFAFIPPPLLGWAQTLELSRLDDQTAEQAASYLRRLWELTPEARDEFGLRIGAAVASLVTPPPPPGTPPWAFLAAVLAVRREREMARLAMHQAAAAPGQYPAAPYPAAQYPGTQYPPTQHPPTQHPPTQHPPTQHPATQHPATQYAAQYPATQYAAQYPPAQHPATQYPGTQYPPPSFPPAQQPPAQQPGAQQPGAQQPGAPQPAVQQPGAPQPAAQQPGVPQPAAPEPSAPVPAPTVPGQQTPDPETPASGAFTPPV